MNKAFYIALFSSIIFSVLEAKNLEDRIQDFVLETRKIEIPGHPYAFNPSIVCWRGLFVLSFRELPPLEDSFSSSISSSGPSRIGIVFLNEDFSLAGEPQMLSLPAVIIQGKSVSRAEDARLVNIDERLILAYSDNLDEVVTQGGFRMYIGELDFDGNIFFLKSIESITSFPQASPTRREKNWVPFDFCGNLLLAYSIKPHQILYPYLDGSGQCEMLATSSGDILWKWGELRGGTPALRCGSEYLAFFHSSIEIATEHSNGHVVPHYFIGAYTFQKNLPFALTRVSPEPIIGKDFYHGLSYSYYWKPVQVIFPCGFVFDDQHIWLAYGRQDHEIWIAKLDKDGLFSSLKPVLQATISKEDR